MPKNADAATVTATPAKRGRKQGTIAVPVTVMVSYYSRVHGVPVTEDMAASLYRGSDKAGKDAMRESVEMQDYSWNVVNDAVAAMSDEDLVRWDAATSGEVARRAGNAAE
jgi:hypothetical protein